MIKRFGGLFIVAGLLCAAGPPEEAPLPALQALYQRPAAIPFPEDNPFTPAKAELGRRLFADPILSRSGTLSCANCHRADRSLGDGRPRGIGDRGLPMALRTPTLLDVAWQLRLGWDGKFRDIESVTFAASTGPANMDLPAAQALARLEAEPTYRQAFAEVFGPGPIGQRQVELALATYERTLVAGQAPFDRWIAGDPAAIGPDAVRGFVLFNGRAGCAACHSGWDFTDGSFHDVGTARDADIGRGRLFPSSVKLRYAFKVPTLRDVARRGPYMHDGSIPTLQAVIDHYDQGGIDRPSRSVLIRPLGLSDADKADLVAFLQTLSEGAPGAE